MKIQITWLIRVLAFLTTSFLIIIYNELPIWYSVLIASVGILWFWVGSVRVAGSHVGFLVFVVLISLDVLLFGISPLAIFAIHIIIAQWDLQNLSTRMRLFEVSPETEAISVHHLRRLAIVMVAGLILSFTTLYIRTNLPLYGIILCALVLFAALSRTIQKLGRDSA